MKRVFLAGAACFALGLGLNVSMSKDSTPGFNTIIPPYLLTADTVESRIGPLKFVDGMPTPETSKLLYDNLDVTRGMEAFLNFIPAASLEAIRTGMEGQGVTSSNSCLLYEDLMDSNSLFLTGNTDTIYAICLLDLERDGPTVIEIPPGAGPGTVNDAYFRFVIDMGAPGPDRGKGGKYLIIPPDYDGEIPEGYFTATSNSYVNWVPLRGLLKDGKTDAAVEMWKSGLKVYPLSEAENPPEMNFINGSGKEFNTIHSNDYSFFDELNRVIQKEPVSFLDPELRGLLASLGMKKGAEWNPDERMRVLLTEAVSLGNATARALAFDSRSDSIYLYEGRESWYRGIDGGNYQWLIDDGLGGRNLDARSLFFYVATVNTPAMVMKMIGKGSQYALNARDSKGRYLNGKDAYKLTIPGDVPAQNFWSVVVYDPQTRSMLQTSQPYPSKNNERNRDMVYNEDGSVDLYFGPKPPKGKLKANWIQTEPGKHWFTILRLYGPLEPWFDQSWQPGEIERL